MDTKKHFFIIGAGPAGLTAARELLRQGCTSVTIVEQEAQVGGISKTVHYKGNCIDLKSGKTFFCSGTGFRAFSTTENTSPIL